MLQRPNKKSFTSAAVQAVCLSVGIKVGDGIAALLPESTASYKHWIVGAAGLAIAACVNPSTTAGLAAQSAALGIAANGFYNGITEVITPSVPVQDSASLSGRFVNALVGHKVDALDAAAQDFAALGAANWEPAFEVANAWDRPQEEERTMQIALG